MSTDPRHHSGPFWLCWVSVDGAGRNPTPYPQFEQARQACDASQRGAHEPRDGYVNPWGYGYFVRDDRGDVRYRASRLCHPTRKTAVHR